MNSFFTRTVFLLVYFLVGCLVIGARVSYLLMFDHGAWVYADALPAATVILLVMWMGCLPFLWLIGVSFEVIGALWNDANEKLD